MEIIANKQSIKNLELYSKMSSGLEKLLGKVEKDIKKNKNISRALISKREIKKYLSSLQ